MKNVLTSTLVIVRLFVATFIVAFCIAATITYFVTSVKFALFLASASLVPASLFIAFYYDKYLADEL
jgi:hypothetical protein